MSNHLIPRFALGIVCLGSLVTTKHCLAQAPTSPKPNPIYPLTTPSPDSVKSLLEMDEHALLDLVPPQGGFFYVDCPNCEQGAQDRQIEWVPGMGDTVRCKFCGQVYPSEKYPYNGQMEVKTPTGKTQVFRYYQDADGKKYFLEAKRWYLQRELLQDSALKMASLYASDPVKYAEAGRRAALILKRFADTYPDYIARFDYPGRPKQFFPEGFPAKLTPYRASKWYWWGYGDVSRPLLYTYDILKQSPLLSPADKTHIEKDLFQAMLDWVAHNYGTQLGNMHPMLWTSESVASRVLNQPALGQQVTRDIRQLINEDFLYDGMWHEGSPAYHVQTVNGLRAVTRSMHPELSEKDADAIADRELPELKQSTDAVNQLRLPNGVYATIKDSWADFTSDQPLMASHPQLLPALGYAILGLGSGPTQMQAHLGFTARFGHNQYDSLSFLLFGDGAEAYSDLGYTHSRARGWDISTAAHNTVVIDQKSQGDGADLPSKAMGNLRLFDASDANFQVVEADAPDAYPKLATTYRRALLAVNAPGGTKYVVDIFDVAGGKRHDWMLHGSADQEQNLELMAGGKPLDMSKESTLLPAGMSWQSPKEEGEAQKSLLDGYAYGFFRDAKAANADGNVIATFRNRATPSKGSQTWLVGMPGSRYTQAQAWAIRNIRNKERVEDDGKLDERYRQSLIVTRQGASDRFVAVHCPLSGTSPIKNVTALPFGADGTALKIERSGGTDYVLFAPTAKPRVARDGKLELNFDGRAAIAHFGGSKPVLKMVGGTSFSCGTTKIVSKTGEVTAKLQSVQGNQFTIDGSVASKPGAVFIVQHGDGRTTAFHIKSARQQNGSTVLITQEPAALTGDVSGPLTIKQYPQFTYPAPHSLVLVSSMQSSPK